MGCSCQTVFIKRKKNMAFHFEMARNKDQDTEIMAGSEYVCVSCLYGRWRGGRVKKSILHGEMGDESCDHIHSLFFHNFY